MPKLETPLRRSARRHATTAPRPSPPPRSRLGRFLATADVRKVFGEPVVHGDATVIPAAEVASAFGIGVGSGRGGDPAGEGGGGGGGGGGTTFARAGGGGGRPPDRRAGGAGLRLEQARPRRPHRRRLRRSPACSAGCRPEQGAASGCGPAGARPRARPSTNIASP